MQQSYDGTQTSKEKGGIPSRLRVGLYVCIAADIGLLIIAHTSVGATTQVTGSAPFGLLKPHIASSDNLISAVGRLAGSNAWFLVFIVAIMSGVLPYVKLLATLLAVGLVDMGTISKDRCRFCLEILEIAGKYSFADVFLICMNLVMFDIHTGTYTILAVFTLEVNLYMQLHSGAIALIIAITFSAFLTQWAAYELTPGMPPKAEEELPLHDGARAIGAPGSSSFDASGTLAVRPFWRSVVAECAALGAVALIIVGSMQPIIQVDRGGFLGHLSRPAEDQTLYVSLMSLVSDMTSNAVSEDQSLTVRFFVFFIIVLAFIMPILELTFLIVNTAASHYSVWCVYWSRVCAEWCSSFDCIEVVLIVALATLMELERAVVFNIGDECKPFEAIMSNKGILTIAGLGFAADTECFTLKSHIQPGFYVLLAGVVLRTIAWRFIPPLETESSGAIHGETYAKTLHAA